MDRVPIIGTLLRESGRSCPANASYCPLMRRMPGQNPGVLGDAASNAYNVGFYDLSQGATHVDRDY